MSNLSDSNLPTSDTQTAAPSIINMLDPELAAACRAGNGAVLSAVAGGATTTQMVVNDIIRMGGSAAGLPAGVQVLVDERRREMEREAKAHEGPAKKPGSVEGVAEMIMAAAVVPQEERYNSKNDNLDGGAFSKMSIAEMQKIDFAQYEKMSEPEKKQFNNEAMNKAKGEKKTAEKGINDIIDQMQADGRSAKDIQDVILAAQGYKAEDDLKTPEGQKRQQERIAELSPELRKYAEPMGKFKTAEAEATDAMSDIVFGKEGDNDTRYKQTKKGIDKTAKAADHNKAGQEAASKYGGPRHVGTEAEARAAITSALSDGYYSTSESNRIVAYDSWEERRSDQARELSRMQNMASAASIDTKPLAAAGQLDVPVSQNPPTATPEVVATAETTAPTQRRPSAGASMST